MQQQMKLGLPNQPILYYLRPIYKKKSPMDHGNTQKQKAPITGAFLIAVF